jgi:hypothetical protein
MRKSRFTEAQIFGMIKEQEAGLPTAELCRKHGLSPATFYKLKAKYGGMDLSDANRLKQLEGSVRQGGVNSQGDVPNDVEKRPGRRCGFHRYAA